MTDSPRTPKVADEKNLPNSTENNSIQSTSSSSQAEIHSIRILSPSKNKIKPNFLRTESLNKIEALPKNKKHAVGANKAVDKQKIEYPKNADLQMMNSALPKISEIETEKNSKISKNSLTKNNNNLSNNSEMNMKSQNDNEAKNSVQSPILQMELGFEKMKNKMVRSEMIEKVDHETENYQTNVQKTVEENAPESKILNKINTLKTDEISLDERKTKRVSFYKTKDREKNDLSRQNHTLVKSLIKSKTFVKPTNAENVFHTLVKNQTTSIKEEKKMPLRKKEISKTNVQKTSKTLLKESFSSLTSKMVRFQTKSEKIKMTKNFSNRNATKNNLLAENDPRLSSKNSNLVFVNNNNFLDDEEEEKNDELLEEAATEEPTAEEPAFEEPAAEEPFAENSVAGEPAAEELAAKKLVAEQPPTEEPAAEQIASEKPTAEEPTAEEPTAEEPASEAKPFEEIVSSTAPNIKNESTRKVTQKSGEIKTSQVQALSKKASSGQKKSLKSQNESRKISALTTGAEGKVSKAMQRSEILPIASDKVELDAQAEEKKVIVSVKSVEKEVESDEPIHSTIEGVEIIEIDRKRQYIKVENKEQQEISLSSKVLLQRYDDAIYTVYLFPQYTLKAKTVVTVWSNGATNKVEDESNLVHKLQAFWACSGPTTKTILCNDATPYLWSKAKRSKVSKELDACDEVIKKVKQSKEGTGISYGKTRIVKSFDMSEFYEELDKDLLNPCVFHGCLNKKPVKQMDLTCETAVTKTGEVFDCDKLLKERKKNKTLDSNSLACDCDKYKRSSKKKSRRTKNCGCDSDDLEFKNDKKIKNTFKQKFSSKKRGCNNSRSKPDCSCDDSKKNNSSNDSSSDDCYQKKYKKLKSYESSLTNNSSKSVEECLKLLEQTKRLMDDDDGGDCDGFCSRFKNGGKPKSFENGVECSDSDDSCQNVETKKKKSKVIQMKDSEKCFPKKNKQKNNSYQRKERDFCKNSDDEYELNNFLLCGEKEDNSACAKNWKKQNLSDQKTQNNSMKYKKKISEEFDSECENDYKKQYKPENIINSREKQKTSCDDYTKKQTKLDEDFLFVFDAKNMKSELKRNDNDCLCNDWDFSNDSFEIRQPRYEDNDFECKLLSKRNQSEDNFKDYTKKQTKLDKNFFAEFGSQNGNSTFGNNKKVSCDELDLSNDSFRIMEPKVKKKVEKSKNFNKQETKANKKHEKNFFRGNKCKISNKNFSSNRELISSCDSDSDDSLDSISENKIVKSKSEKPVLTIKGILKNKQVTSCVNENKERFNDELDFSFNENKISKDFLTSKIETNTYIPRRIEDKLKYLREMKDINDSFNNNIYNKEKKSFLSNIEAQSQMIKESFIFSDGNNNNNNKTIQNPSVTPQKQNNKVFVTKRSSDSKHEMMDLRKSDKSKKSSKFEKNLPNSLDEGPGLLQKNSIILKDEKTVKKMNFSREKNAAEKSTSQERKSMFVKTNSRINEAKTTEKMENAALKTFTKTSFQKNTSKARENAFKKSVFKHGSKIENFSVEKTLFKEKYNYSSINKQNNFNNLKSFPIKKFDEGDPRIRARSSNMIPVNNNRPLDDEDEEEEEEENENPPKTAEEAPAEAAEEAPPEAAEKAPPEAAEKASLEAAEETPAEAVEKAPLEAAEEALSEAAEEALTEAAEEAPLEIAEKAVEEALPKEVASEKTALEEITPELVEKTIPEIEPEAFEAADEVVSQPIERNEASENKIEVDTEAKPVVNDGETNNIQKEPLVGDEGFNDAQVATSKAIFKVGSVQSRKSETEKKFSKVEQKPQSNLNEEDFFVPNGCESKVQEFKIVDVDKKRQFIRIKYISDEILESSSNVLVQRFNNSIYTAFFFMTSILNPGDIVTLWSEDANEKVVNSWNFVHQKQSYWACVGPSTVTILEKWDENVYKHFWTENAKLPEKSKKPNSGSSLKQKYKNGENIVKSFDLSDLCNESDDDLFGCTLYCCSKKPVKQMVLSCENGEKNSHQNGHFNCDLFCESLKHNEACSTNNCDCERHVSGFKQRSKKRKDRGCGCNGGSANNETKQIETTSSESIKSNEFEERVENIKNNYELKKAEKIKPSKKVKDCMKLLNITDKLLDDEFDMTSSGSKRFEAVDKKNKKSKKIFENLDSCFSNDDQEDENSCGSSGSEVVKTLSKNCGKNDLCTEQDIEELENNEDHVRKCCEKNSRSPRKDENTNKDIRNKKYSYKKHDDSFEKPETEEDGDELVRKCCQNYFKPLKKEKKRENKYSSKDCQKYKKGLKNKDSIENYKIENYLACNSDDGDDKDCNFDHCAFCRCSGDKKNKYNSALKKCYNQARSSIEEDYTLERFLKCSDSDKNDDCEDTCGFCRCNKTKNNIQVSQHKLSETSHASDNDEHQSDTSCGCCKNYRTTSPSEDRSSCFCLEYTTEESD